MKHGRALGIAAVAAALAGGVALAVRHRHAPALPPSSSAPAPKARTLPERLVEVALRYLPEPYSKLEEPDPRWDKVLGGKLGPGRWKYFSTGYGTTCGITAADFLAEAGAPKELINREPPEGSGFTPGAHITKIIEGARKRGWLHTAKDGELPDLTPGQLYISEKPLKDKDGKEIDGAHIGTILSVAKKGDTLEIETADGGQGTREHQQALRRRRTVKLSDGTLTYPDGSTIPKGTPAIVTPGIGNTRLAWWVQLGEEPIA